MSGKLFVSLLLLSFVALGAFEYWLIQGLAPAV